MKFLNFLLLFFACYQLQAQPKIINSFKSTSNSGLCSQSMKIFDDHTYLFESGCEASSSVNYGKWSKKDNRIILSPTKQKSIESFMTFNIDTTEVNPYNISLKFLDKYERPITGLILLLVPKALQNNETSTNPFGVVTIKREAKSDMLLEAIKANNGEMTLPNLEEYVLQLPQLKDLVLNINDFDFAQFNGKTVTITLDINKEVLSYPQLDWARLPSLELMDDQGLKFAN